MKTRTQILLQIPEYYLIALSLLAAYTLPFSFKLMTLVVVVILVLQLIFKNKTTGHIIASFFLIGNIFMLIALTSGMKEFPKFLTNAKVYLFGGLLLFAFHLLISGLMLLKYPIKEELPKLQTEP
jgi:hypothetical protein